MKTRMNQMKLFKYVAALNLMLAPIGIDAFAQADKGGNGGDGLIAQFEFNVEQIQGWLQRGNIKKVDLSSIQPTVDAVRLANDVADAAKQVLNHSIKLEFTDEEQKVGEEARTCKNFADLKLIRCNNARWNGESPESLYMLTMHELISIAGYENNDGTASEYKISRKILPYVAPSTTYILVDDLGYDDPEKWEKMLRCAGMVQDRTSPWSLKRRKEAVVNAFGNGDTYVTSIVKDVGSWQEQITGGTRGHWKTTHTGIAAVTHFFTDGFAKAKVVKQDADKLFGINFSHPAASNSDGDKWYRVEIFGKTRWLKFGAGDLRTAVVYDQFYPFGGIPMAALECTYMVYPKSKLANFKTYIETLPSQGWKTIDRDENLKDIRASDACVLSPRETNWEW